MSPPAVFISVGVPSCCIFICVLTMTIFCGKFGLNNPDALINVTAGEGDEPLLYCWARTDIA